MSIWRTVPTRAETKAATRQAILDAAAEVFAAEGFGGASVRRIAQVAGHTTGALFAHFPTKEAVFLALLEDRYDRKLSAVTETLAQGGLSGLSDRFSHLGQLEPDEDLLATEFWLYAARRPEVSQRLSDVQARLRSGVAVLVSANVPGLSAVDAERVATAILAIGDGLGTQARLHPAAVDPHLFGDCVRAVVAGLTDRRETRASPSRR